MGKRSSFPRRKHDAYQTPHRATLPLIPFLKAEGLVQYSEPCDGAGDLVRHLTCYGFSCVDRGDIQSGRNALDVPRFPAPVVTNPPWTRQLLHPLLEHFMRASDYCWLLLDADWMHLVKAKPYIRHCTHVVSVGRVKWIPGSKHTGKDNAAWYRFDIRHRTGPHFYGRDQMPVLMEVAA